MLIRRGEVYFVDLGPAFGHEQAGRRPVVVVSNEAINSQPLVVMIVPGTKRKRSPVPSPSCIIVPAGEGGLPLDTVFLTFQARALDHERFQEEAWGVLGSPYLKKIERSLMWTLGLTSNLLP